MLQLDDSPTAIARSALEKPSAHVVPIARDTAAIDAAAPAGAESISEQSITVDALVYQHLDQCQRQARMMARRFRAGLLDPDDCAQSASMALLESARRFDASRGVPFAHYIRPRVRGAVLDLLRAELRARMHRFPNASERIAQRLDGRDDVHEDAFESLVDLIGEVALGLMLDDVSLSAARAHEEEMLYGVFNQQTHQFIDQLSARPRELIHLHYFHQLTFSEIAEKWQLSKGRISQLHSSALRELRELMR
jgi:RNA polymerase sigma factor FliA